MDSKIKKDFPILRRKINGKPLVYLDSAATSQKPTAVLDMIKHYYTKHNANVHRGIHTLSVEATEEYELARGKVADFVGVKDPSEIIFVRNATEAINLVAYSWGRNNISKGDEIVLTVAEHHSNFVVWQQLAIENGAILKIIPIDENGELDLVAFKKALTKKTKLVTLFHVSNVLGTINDVNRLSVMVHWEVPKAKVLIDGAQAVPHMPVNIPKIGCDFYVFTGHKMLGPTGIGVLWGKRKLLEEMPPFLFGGEMISKVSLDKSSWNELPWKFEAGTPNIAGAIGLGAAVDYLKNIGMDKVREHEIELTKYAIDRLSKIEGVTIYGPKMNVILEGVKRPIGSKSRDSIASPRSVHMNVASLQNDKLSNKAGVISFNIGNPSTRSARSGSTIHAHDVASILDGEGIAIRSGHHCAQPLMDFLGISSAARASFYIYNDKGDVDRLVEGIMKAKKTFKIK